MNNFKSYQEKILKENSKEKNMERVRISNEKRLEGISNETRNDCDTNIHDSVTPFLKVVKEVNNTSHDIKYEVNRLKNDIIPKVHNEQNFISEANKNLSEEVHRIPTDVNNAINENIQKIMTSYEDAKYYEMQRFCQDAHYVLTEFKDERYKWMKKVEEKHIISTIGDAITIAIIFRLILFPIITWMLN